MCQSFIFLLLGFTVTFVQGTFLFAEKKENIICKKVCPLYCKDHYEKGNQRRWDYDMSPQSYVGVSAPKSGHNEKYRDTYNFYFGQSSRPSQSSTTSTTTTEEPTLISSSRHRSMSRHQDSHQDFPPYPSFKEFPPDYEGDFGEIEEEYFYPYSAPYYYKHPHSIQETTTPSTTTTTEEPTFICMVCLRKCPPR